MKVIIYFLLIVFIIKCFSPSGISTETAGNSVITPNNIGMKKIEISNFYLKPKNKYFKNYRLESNHLSPFEIKPIIYKINITDFNNERYYLAKIHSNDALGFSYDIKLTCNLKKTPWTLFYNDDEEADEKIFDRENFKYISKKDKVIEIK